MRRLALFAIPLCATVLAVLYAIRRRVEAQGQSCTQGASARILKGRGPAISTPQQSAEL